MSLTDGTGADHQYMMQWLQIRHDETLRFDNTFIENMIAKIEPFASQRRWAMAGQVAQQSQEAKQASKEVHRRIAYEHLRQLLILSQLTRGQRLRETEWAERLGVNRPALREAFARLEAEGLLVLGPKTGYFVPRLEDGDIDEIIMIRLMIETAAIEAVCTDTKDVSLRLRSMRDAHAEFESMASKHYVLGTIEADRRFHEALVDASGSSMLARLYRRAPLPMISRKIAQQAEWDAAAQVTILDHGNLIDALAAKSAAKAKRILETHLRRAAMTSLLLAASSK